MHFYQPVAEGFVAVVAVVFVVDMLQGEGSPHVVGRHLRCNVDINQRLNEKKQK